jgi:hypothetical protein
MIVMPSYAFPRSNLFFRSAVMRDLYALAGRSTTRWLHLSIRIHFYLWDMDALPIRYSYRPSGQLAVLTTFNRPTRLGRVEITIDRLLSEATEEEKLDRRYRILSKPPRGSR